MTTDSPSSWLIGASSADYSAGVIQITVDVSLEFAKDVTKLFTFEVNLVKVPEPPEPLVSEDQTPSLEIESTIIVTDFVIPELESVPIIKGL